MIKKEKSLGEYETLLITTLKEYSNALKSEGRDVESKYWKSKIDVLMGGIIIRKTNIKRNSKITKLGDTNAK